MLIKIKNAQNAGHSNATFQSSRMKSDIAEVLKSAGYITDYENKKKKGRKGELDFLDIKLKYTDGEGVISGVNMISTQSRRIYAGKGELFKLGRKGVTVLSTSLGIMTNKTAAARGVGGEVMFEIW
ncbi:MAG: small subunit ribosomal protein S8 [Parcubacteria group bacterium Licking1014_17]|nr:MAG: small subunit ribosomal protein S8 [Parcubacteria group bacterium Licking1014_17]